MYIYIYTHLYEIFYGLIYRCIIYIVQRHNFCNNVTHQVNLFIYFILFFVVLDVFFLAYLTNY